MILDQRVGIFASIRLRILDRIVCGSELELALQAELTKTVANGCGDVLRR